MKTYKILAATCLCAVAACQDDNSGSNVTLFSESDFQTTVDDKAVSLYTLRAGDIVMQVTNFGARVVALWTPDKDGHYDDIVLGYKDIETYINNPGERFLGAVVGPYANRIAKGELPVGDSIYTLPQNNNGQTLHGGLKGLDMVVWDVKSHDQKSIVFTYLHPDGQDGFPGNVNIEMTYSLNEENEFSVTYSATTDQSTVVNISHHSFFNLKGEGNGTILDHLMTINASKITPVDSLLIPTGELMDVTDTPFDFRKPHTIGERIDTPHPQLTCGSGYDHNWVLDKENEGALEWAATVEEPASGRVMEVFTDQPAMQFYCGNFFDGSTCGKYDRPLRYRESIALETQKYPDSPHHAHFPSTALNPGEEYTHTCVYRFSVKK